MTQSTWLLDIDEPTRELAHGIVVGLVQALSRAHGEKWVPHEGGLAIELNREMSPGSRQRCQLHMKDGNLTTESNTDFDDSDDDDGDDDAFQFYGTIVDGGDDDDAEGRALSTLRAWETALAQPVGDDARQIDMLRKEAAKLALGAVEALRLDWHCIAVSIGMEHDHRLTVMTKSYDLLDFTPEGGGGAAGRMNSGLAEKCDVLARWVVEQQVDEEFPVGMLNLEITPSLTASLHQPIGPVERMAAIAALPTGCRLIVDRGKQPR